MPCRIALLALALSAPVVATACGPLPDPIPGEDPARFESDAGPDDGGVEPRPVDAGPLAALDAGAPDVLDAGAGDDPDAGDDDGTDAGSDDEADAGVDEADAGFDEGAPDAGTDEDEADAGFEEGEPDAGFEEEEPDAGASTDAPDAGFDDEEPDAGTTDAGTFDAGTPDAGTTDAGTADAGTADAGAPGSCIMSLSWPPFEGQTHIDPPTPITYAHNPPASGDHWPYWARWMRHDTVVEREFWVHNAEHGGIVFLYGPRATQADRAALIAAYDATPMDEACQVHRRALLTSDPKLDDKIALVAWGVVLQGECVDPDAVAAFVATYRNHGPEEKCDEGWR